MSNAYPLHNVSCIREVTQRKKWLADGAIYLDHQSVEHVIQPPDSLELKGLSEHTLVLLQCTSTRRVNQFAGQEYDGVCKADHFFLLPAGTPAKLAWESQDEALLFSIAPQSLCQTAEQTGVDPYTLELTPLVHKQDERITYIAYGLREEIRTTRLGSRLYSEALLTNLNLHLLRHYCTFKVKPPDYRGGLAPYKLKKVLNYIDNNLADSDLSIGVLSQLAGLSRSYFVRLFKQAVGTSPHQYVILQRLEKSKRLLQQRQLTIAEVAIECGFSNQSHFYGAFRRVAGTTPKRYRESL